MRHPECASSACKRRILPGQVVWKVPGPGGWLTPGYAHDECVQNQEWRSKNADKKTTFTEDMNWLSDQP
jgi:hypothetical protein